MTSPFQTELRARAAAHAREWQAAADPSVGLVEVETTVRRRRRGRALLAGAGAVAGAAVIAGVAYVGLGQGPDAVPGTSAGETTVPSVGAPSALAPLTEVVDGSAVLIVDDPNVAAPGLRALIVDERGLQANLVMSPALVRDALGSAIEGWPDVTLVAIAPAGHFLIFELDNPSAFTTPRVALHNTSDGTTTVVDPCAADVPWVDLLQFCATGPHSAWVVDPKTGEAFGLSGYVDCDVADQLLDGDLVARCDRTGLSMQVVSINRYSGEATEIPGFDSWILGAPFVVDGHVYANFNTTEGDPVFGGAVGSDVTVGGASVAGIARVGDSVVVRTGSDQFGAQPSMGRVLGVLDPATGEFAAIDMPDTEDLSPVAVPLLP